MERRLGGGSHRSDSPAGPAFCRSRLRESRQTRGGDRDPGAGRPDRGIRGEGTAARHPADLRRRASGRQSGRSGEGPDRARPRLEKLSR